MKVSQDICDYDNLTYIVTIELLVFRLYNTWTVLCPTSELKEPRSTTNLKTDTKTYYLVSNINSNAEYNIALCVSVFVYACVCICMCGEIYCCHR